MTEVIIDVVNIKWYHIICCFISVQGEYIDLNIGAALTISTMAAAGLGNLISDLAGLGLADRVRCGLVSCVSEVHTNRVYIY